MNCNDCGKFWEECKCDDSAQSRGAEGGTNLTDVFAASIERVMEFVMARERWVVETPGCERVGLNDIERVLAEELQKAAN